MSKVSVVIRSYNEEKYIRECLEAIFNQQTSCEVEVILVDSGSTDKTLAIAKEFDLILVHIKKSDFSFGRSLNYGCKIASGQYLIFISAHCIPVDKNWIDNLVAPFEDDNIAMSYGKQEGVEWSKFSEQMLFKKYFPDEDKNPQDDFFSNNANSCIRKCLWEEYPFNEELTGLEDMDWSKHFFLKGMKVAYISSASVYHIHEETWSKVRTRYEREAYALKEIMPEVQLSIIDVIKFITSGVFKDWRESIKRRVFFKNFLSVWRFRFNQYVGSYKGNHIHRKVSKNTKNKYFYPS
ncbi:glycosyltransferase family A protein [Roseivirga sp. UBA838]|uniref:glycosyltransferase n=1 Tax=Roseivirga sp. UBA838 TaxID=1947393 RepID=UPI00257FD8DE|nr:glycosyltransferase family A protein [Roseivirga sp. UBA838]|tara:strand:+ start:53586 stop:54467 length:882 start_codon:yes stop_codon:yes gene_type:complete